MKNRLMLILTIAHAVSLSVAIALIKQEIVPIHWGPSGVADNFGSKWTMLLFVFIPLIMHLGETYSHARTKENSAAQKNAKLEGRTLSAVTLFFIAVSWGVYAMTAANMTDIGGIFPGALAMLLGLLLMYISNSLPAVKQNRWYGIKVYWTLTDEEVWKRTHRFGAYTGVAGGFLTLLGGVFALLNDSPLVAAFAVFAGILGVGVIPVIYAGIYYRKLHPKKAGRS